MNIHPCLEFAFRRTRRSSSTRPRSWVPRYLVLPRAVAKRPYLKQNNKQRHNNNNNRNHNNNNNTKQNNTYSNNKHKKSSIAPQMPFPLCLHFQV